MDILILNIENRPAMQTIFSDLEELDYARVFKTKYCFPNSLFKYLSRIHRSRKINKVIELPGKDLWNRYCPLLQMEFEKNNEYYITFIEVAALQYTIDELKSLKAHHNVHLCLMLFNPLNVLLRDENFSKMMTQFEFDKYFAIFDETDISKPMFKRLTAIYSKIDIQPVDSSIQSSDFFFMGLAKDRQEEIQDLYTKIIENGKSADFTIVSPDPSKKKVDGINYTNRFMDYEQYLKHVYKTNCIVEIVQGCQKGVTLRTYESIVYGKHLLTNNDVLAMTPFYSKETMHYYRTIDDFDLSMDFLDILPADYNGQYSPTKLLEEIKR